MSGCLYVATTVTWYRSCVVELGRSRSVHAVEHDPCCPDPTKLAASDCRAVHYGLCSPLLKLPAFSCPPANHPCVPLLAAADLEQQLEQLVSSFVARDKAARAALPAPSAEYRRITGVRAQIDKLLLAAPARTGPARTRRALKPFLAKGSVAERVLLFECCPPSKTTPAPKTTHLAAWRPGDVHNKTQFWEVVADVDKNLNAVPRIRRESSIKQAIIPRFHFPEGRAQQEPDLERIASVFSGLAEGKASKQEFGIVTKACGLPLYWKVPLYLAARGDKKAVGCDTFLDYWRRLVNLDEASKFVRVLTRGTRSYLCQEDFYPLLQDVIDTHPGLSFLREAIEFHSRYVQTVVARIYYCVNRSWSGKITVNELRKSNFLQVLSTLEEEEDINQITEYFSYEHFYVIYCKFWELDRDHDLLIDQNDLKQHNGGALSSRILDRIFSGAVTRQKKGMMTYSEFVWFLISEEDKRHPRSVEYWFRCMDLDGDGFLSMYELEYFYEEQMRRLEALGIETLPFVDCLCQMLDMVEPRQPGKISLSDLKRCKMTPLFFDTFFNLEKYLDHEQRDPFASQREHDGPEPSDWDKYAAEEYELLVAEEGNQQMIFDEEEEMVRHLDKARPTDTEDEDYADSDDYHY